jgi:hypothetical protein
LGFGAFLAVVTALALSFFGEGAAFGFVGAFFSV